MRIILIWLSKLLIWRNKMRYYLKSIDEYKVSKVQWINKNNGKLYYYYAIRKFQFYDTNYEKRIIHDIT